MDMRLGKLELLPTNVDRSHMAIVCAGIVVGIAHLGVMLPFLQHSPAKHDGANRENDQADPKADLGVFGQNERSEGAYSATTNSNEKARDGNGFFGLPHVSFISTDTAFAIDTIAFLLPDLTHRKAINNAVRQPAFRQKSRKGP